MGSTSVKPKEATLGRRFDSGRLHRLVPCPGGTTTSTEYRGVRGS